MADRPDKKDDLLRRPLYLYSLPAGVLSTLAYEDVTAATAAETPPAAPTEGEYGGGPGADEGKAESAAPATVTGSLACTLCGLSFASAIDRRSHGKSDLHLYNMKQKLHGKPAVTEAAFERLVGSLDESLSGSDWSSSDDESDENGSEGGGGHGQTTTVLAALLKKQAVLSDRQRDEGSTGGGGAAMAASTGGMRARDKHAAAAATASIQPLVWFSSSALPKDNYFGIYRAMFTAAELAGGDINDGTGAGASIVPGESLLAAIRSRQLAPTNGAPTSTTAHAAAGRHVFLCMIGGGHFAASVVALAPRKIAPGSVPMNREATVLAHKTFHRYTTRRKQGGAQSANDASKGTAHSAGSSLRRYNEQALIDDVRSLLREWQPLLDSADLLFVRASGTTNKRTLFGPYPGQVLQPRDPRLRSFPFNTRRPTQNEIMRAFIELTRLKVRQIAPASAPASAAAAAAAGAPTPPPSAKRPAAPKRSEEEEMAIVHSTQLLALARRSKVPSLLSYLQTNGLSASEFRFTSADSGTAASASALHHAPTLLHLAASQNSPALVSALLLRAGADPVVRNADGKTPFELAGDRATRDAFRVARGELEKKKEEEGREAPAEKATGSCPAIDWDAARVPAALTRADVEQRDAQEKEESAKAEAARRRAAEARLREEEAAAKAKRGGSRTAGSSASTPLQSVLLTAEDKRQQQTRGLTAEQRMRLERERRARAAEDRIRRMQQGGQ